MAKANDEKKRVKAVYIIQQKEGSTDPKDSFWIKIGVAFVNKDESLNVLLDALPIDGKLHIRNFKAKEEAQA